MNSLKYQSRHSSQSTEASTDSGASSFSDETETLGSPPALEPPLPKKHIATLLTKTTLCKHFLRGHCRFGEKCSYAHSKAELLAKPDLVKTRMCSHFLLGRCRNDNCNFAHGVNEVQQKAGSEEPPSPTSPVSLATPWRLPPGLDGLDGDMSMSQPASPQLHHKPQQASLQDMLQQPVWQAVPMTPEKSQMQRRRQQEPWRAEPMKVGLPQETLAAPKMVGIQGAQPMQIRPDAMAHNQNSQTDLYDVLRTCEHADHLSDAMRFEMACLLLSNCRMTA